MRRYVLAEKGRPALPPIDLGDALVIVGSGPAAQVRLPAGAAAAEHVRIEGGQWRALMRVQVDGVTREAGEGGPLGSDTVFELTGYVVRTQPLPSGSQASAPQRTESLARELVRSLLGGDAAPAFEVEVGPSVGAVRMLPPPESTVVVGRGDEADWIILDEDLSRRHAEIRRGWDGIQIRDLESKNGTRIEGVAVGGKFRDLRDGNRVELGDVVLRFRDPAERHLRGQPLAPSAANSVVSMAAAVQPDAPAGTSVRSRAAGAPSAASAAGFWALIAIAALAVIGAIWVLAS